MTNSKEQAETIFNYCEGLSKDKQNQIKDALKRKDYAKAWALIGWNGYLNTESRAIKPLLCEGLHHEGERLAEKELNPIKPLVSCFLICDKCKKGRGV